MTQAGRMLLQPHPTRMTGTDPEAELRTLLGGPYRTRGPDDACAPHGLTVRRRPTAGGSGLGRRHAVDLVLHADDSGTGLVDHDPDVVAGVEPVGVLLGSADPAGNRWATQPAETGRDRGTVR